MENIKCIVCDIDDTETILYCKDIRYKTSEETFKIVKCRNCGLIYLNPRPSKEEMGNFILQTIEQEPHWIRFL